MFTIALLLVQVLATQASVFHSTHPATDLEALCAGKDVDLTEFDQLVALRASISARQTSSCSPNTKKAIVDLASLIERTNGDLCAASSIEALHGFYAEYLDSSSSEEYEKLPKSLKRFALAYGMQMSNLCKKNMVRVLSEEAHAILTQGDFEEIEKLIGDDGPVAEVLGAMGGPDEIFLPGELAPFLRKQGIESADLSHEKMFMQATTGPYIRHLQAVCQRRFKPIYGPLMMPLVRLSNMGFNYKDEPLKCDLKCPAVVREVGQWSRIVFLCEALMNIEIVEDKNAEDLVEGTGTKVVRILTKEEAEAIESTLEENSPEDVARVVYEPKNPVAVENKIFDRSDKKLARAIKSFKTSQSEEDAIRKRMLSRGKALIKSQLKSGHFGVIFSSTFKALRQRKGELASPVGEMAKVIDEMQQEQGPTDGRVSARVGRYLIVPYTKFTITLACIMLLWVGFVTAAIVLG